MAEEVRSALNSTCEAPVPVREPQQAPPSRRSKMRWSPAQHAAWDTILDGCGRVLHARRVSESSFPTSAELLSAVHHVCADVYSLASDLGKYVPCKAELMAEPPLGHIPIQMIDALPERFAAVYRHRKYFL